MDNMTMLDKMQKGLAKVAVIFKRRRIYAWAVFNLYLFGVALKRDTIYSPIRSEGRNVRKYMTECERAMMGFTDGRCHGNHILTKIKIIICKVLDKRGRPYGMWEKFVYDRKSGDVVEEVEKLINSGEIGKLRLAAQCVLYLQIVARWSQFIDRSWLIEKREELVKLIGRWCEEKGIKYDSLMFRLSRENRWLRTTDSVMHPKNWLVWVLT